MRQRLFPTEIQLKDIPPEGRDYAYSRESGELNQALSDLIGKNPYLVEFHLQPMGNAYVLKGSLSTGLDLQCSLCAIDFCYAVNVPLHEMIVVQKKPLGKKDHLTKANHAHEWSDNGPDCWLLDADVFSVGDYIHEQVALAEPIRPLGKPDCDIACDNRKIGVQRDWLIVGDPGELDPLRTNPFQELEKIKLKS